jgi:hypothetical protein
VANRYTVASGLDSSIATWDGGVSVPVEGDRVLVCAGHVVTLTGDRIWGDDSTATVVINGVSTTNSITILGTLIASRTASTSLTSKGGVLVSTGILDMGSEVSPIPSEYNCDLILNKSSVLAAGKYSFVVSGAGGFKAWGYTKKRITTLNGAVAAGATSILVNDATGWKAGDWMYLGNNGVLASQADYVQIGASYVSGLTIPLATALLYPHLTTCPVANTSSNVHVRHYDQAYPGVIRFTTITETVKDASELGYMTFQGAYATYPTYGVVFTQAANYTSTLFKMTWQKIKAVAFTPNSGVANTAVLQPSILQSETPLTFDECTTSGYNKIPQINMAYSGFTVFNDCYLACGFSSIDGTYGVEFNRGWLGTNDASSPLVGKGKNVTVNDAIFFGPGNRTITYQATSPGLSDTTLNNCDCLTLASQILSSHEAVGVQSCGTAISMVISNLKIDPNRSRMSLAGGAKNMTSTGYVKFININSDSTFQEEFFRDGVNFRDNSVSKRSSSSLKMMPITANVQFKNIYPLTIAGGETVRIIGYCQYDTTYASSGFVAPVITLSGRVGSIVLTPATFTASAGVADSWEKFDLSITNTEANGGDLSLSILTQSGVATGAVYISGIIIAPMITQCRHYGFVIDEGNIKRVVNPYTVAAEATAIAYTGVTVNDTTKEISFTPGTADTAQKFYDYQMAFSCANLSTEIPLTRAGSLYSLTSGWTVIEPTYTGCTWGGETIQWDVPATKTGSFDNNTFTFTTAGTYDFSGSTFSGTITLINTSGGAVTVALPAGVSYVNSGPNITVILPVLTASISITGLPNAVGASCRLQIIHTTARSAAAWGVSTAYTVGSIRLRETGIGAEFTAGLYLRCTTAGTSGATAPVWNTTVGGTTVDGTVVWTTYAVLYYDADPAATSLSNTYIDGEEFLVGEVVTIRFSEMDAGASFKRYSTAIIAAVSGFSALVATENDEVYATYGVAGNDYETTYSPDFTNSYITLDTNTDFSGKSAYSYFCYTLTTSLGMYLFWDGVTALDVGNIRIETDVLNLYFNETSGFVKQTDDVRIFRKDGLRPAIDPTTGGNGIEINWRTPVSVVSTGGSALTTIESDKLMGIPTAAVTAAQVRTELTPELSRVDANISSRLPTSGYTPPDNAGIAAIPTNPVLVTNYVAPSSPVEIATAVLSAAQVAPIHSNTRKINDVSVVGAGTDLDPWGPV